MLFLLIGRLCVSTACLPNRACNWGKRTITIDEESSTRAKLNAPAFQPGKGKQYGEEKAEKGEKEEGQKGQSEKSQSEEEKD
jgi:hypothetical protein